MTPNENGARDEMEKCQDESEIYVEIVNWLKHIFRYLKKTAKFIYQDVFI